MKEQSVGWHALLANFKGAKLHALHVNNYTPIIIMIQLLDITLNNELIKNMNDNEKQENVCNCCNIKVDSTMIPKSIIYTEARLSSSADKRHQSETPRHYPDNPRKSAEGPR